MSNLMEQDLLALNLEAYRGRRIVVAMSGGVDSALTAVLLRRAGAEVIGIHMRVWHYDACSDDLNAKIGTCCTPADANDARRVAEQFDFPFYAIDFQADFRRSVIDPFVKDYLHGRTPNPCVMCNSKLKLGTLLGKAKAYGADSVATGHYARVAHTPGGRSRLMRAADLAKDQSYYLFDLTQPQLRGFEMPLGPLTKPQVRQLSRELGLHLAEKADSQDICFVTGGDYREFLRDEAGVEPGSLSGDIVDTAGRKLGRHEGIHNYTVGQRRGIGLGGGEALYVVELDFATQTVVVGGDSEVFSPGLIVERINWVGIEETREPIRVRARIRYRHDPAPAHFEPLGDGRVRITFDEPQRAVTPGQAVVCYDIEEGMSVVAGGWIAVKG